MPVGKIGEIIEQVAEAVTDTRGMLLAYSQDHPEFRSVGGQMLAAWYSGVSDLTR